MAVDEKMQREVDIRRIVEEIVPYIINDPDRFIGSLIFDIYSGMEDVHFESISSVSQYIPNAHALSMKDMEFITPPGNKRLIALNVQHRLLSLKIAIIGVMGVPSGTKSFPAMNKLVPHPELSAECVDPIKLGQIPERFYIFSGIFYAASFSLYSIGLKYPNFSFILS